MNPEEPKPEEFKPAEPKDDPAPAAPKVVGYCRACGKPLDEKLIEKQEALSGAYLMRHGLNLNLTGPREHNLNATVKGGIGSATIELPKDVGVSVHTSGGIGAVVTHGLTENSHDYTNDAFGKSSATIYVTVEGGIGKIELNVD